MDGDRVPIKSRALAMLIEGLERDIAARDNVVVGLYAEAVVAVTLGGALASHRWEIWDCVAGDCGTVQVKTSTGMSIGKRTDEPPSVARWSGFKPGTRWIVETNEFESEAAWHADVWILARVDGLDPFDDAAWSFFVLGREDVQALGARSTNVSALTSRGHRAVNLPELAEEYRRVRSRSV